MFVRACILGLLSLTSETAIAAAQESERPERGQASSRLRVFLDCNCFAEFLRDEIRWVDFVRQAQDADVHLLSSEQGTGGGGRELVLRFVGQGRFADSSTELRVITEVAAPENERRTQVLRTVSVGLLSYAAREGLPSDLDVTVQPPEFVAPVAAPADDLWNLWVFSASAGSWFEIGRASCRERV